VGKRLVDNRACFAVLGRNWGREKGKSSSKAMKRDSKACKGGPEGGDTIRERRIGGKELKTHFREFQPWFIPREKTQSRRKTQKCQKIMKKREEDTKILAPR